MSVSKALREDVADPALQAATITRVEVTHDLSFARIYYTVLGEVSERKAVQAGFDRALPFLRSRVGEEVPLRSVPEIRFDFDKGGRKPDALGRDFRDAAGIAKDKASE